jgi:lipoyl(octanoyl) transferase
VKLAEAVQVRELGLAPYETTFLQMKDFTRTRDERIQDELWLVEHLPVYTLGQGAGMRAVANGIPVVRSDRGGDITYHGPGQVVLYALVDLARRDIKVKRFVWLLEQAVIDLLGRGERKPGAPGIYVEGAKIAALGIRVSRGRAYHGLSLNVDMDLTPFAAIDPCGYPGLPVTQMKDLGFSMTKETAGRKLADHLLSRIENG